MKKILIIEDEPFLGDVLSQKLSEAGYEVTLAQDGKEGLDKISELMPDLVLLDIMLPTLSGYEILEAKHTNEKIVSIPVIIISNSGQPVEIRRALSLGIADYLVKAQFDPMEVLTKVEAVLASAPEHAAAPSPTLAAAAPESAPAAAPASEKRLKGKKVMWVEDDVFINDILSRKLIMEGCEPFNASDGEKALELLKTNVPDIILLDLVLPGISGFDVLEKIKSDPNVSQVPVIVFSNLGQSSDIERALKLGAIKHFVKAEMDVGQIVPEIRTILKMD